MLVVQKVFLIVTWIYENYYFIKLPLKYYHPIQIFRVHCVWNTKILLRKKIKCTYKKWKFSHIVEQTTRDVSVCILNTWSENVWTRDNGILWHNTTEVWIFCMWVYVHLILIHSHTQRHTKMLLATTLLSTAKRYLLLCKT